MQSFTRRGAAPGRRRLAALAVLRLAALAPTLTLVPTASAQPADCAVWDDDGNGHVEFVDAAPLVAEHVVLSGCLSTDLRAALSCQAFDSDADGHVGTLDFSQVRERAARLLDCTGAAVATRPACAEADDNGDGLVTTLDYAGVERLFQAFEACLAVDLSALACRPADYDGDARVSQRDVALMLQRLADFQACLGAQIGGEDAHGPGLWIARERLMTLPTEGAAWDRLLDEADAPELVPDLADQDDRADTRALAKALVGVRLGRSDRIEEVRRAIEALVQGDSELAARTLSLGRALPAYVIAADLIGLPSLDPALDAAFRAKLASLRQLELEGRTLVSTHAERPNNWGTHAGAARVAIALYLGDEADLAAAAEVHRAWVGASSSPTGFRFGDLGWQADPLAPVGVNPRGARRAGLDVDGALPDEMRRGGPLAEPPGWTGYAWEALQGATVTAELLARNGHPDAWSWGDDALLRAVDYLARLDDRFGGWRASGDDRWIPWLVNHATGSVYPAEAGVQAGKNLGFTDWTHAP